MILEKSELTKEHKDGIKLILEGIDINSSKYNFMMDNLINDIIEKKEKQINEIDNN